MTPSVEHVSDTAFLIAGCRAAESARADALFHDPLAARLAGEKGRALVETFPTRAMTTWMAAVRTVVIDRFVRDAIARGTDVVLNLGAGLDTRPYRLDLPPDLRWIEVDYPDVIRFKQEQLEGETPRCRLEPVGLDLADRDARRHLFERLDAGRVLVLTEGVVPYLDNAEAAALADDLRSLAHVDAWVVDYTSPEWHAHRQRSGVAEALKKSPFRFQPDDWFAFFEAAGWRPRQIRYLLEEGRRMGRPAPLPGVARLLAALPLPFASAAMKRSSAYVLLEPA